MLCVSYLPTADTRAPGTRRWRPGLVSPTALRCLSALLVASAAGTGADTGVPTGDRQGFAPAHRLVGVGAAHRDLTDEQISARTEMMIDAQTFGIVRDARSLPGAQKILSPPMVKIFQAAERESGLRWSLIAAIAYLESFGDPEAQSPAGPKGIMQVSSGTAKSMGLRMIYSTRYRTITERQTVKGRRGKPVTKQVRRKVAYSVLVRDERVIPERAIPAAANYVARLEKRYNGLDWAIFAYHCGEGCVASMRELTGNARGMKPPLTVSKMFFENDPTFNREIYQAIQREMGRDWSPTYYFRVLCAERLLGLYRTDPPAFRKLMEEHRYEPNPRQRAPHRLSVWLKTGDLEYQSCEDIRKEIGKRLVRAFENEEYFGFRLRKDIMGVGDSADLENYLHAAPSTIGTLAYIAFETRRLHAAMKLKGEKFVPLEVTSLVQPADFPRDNGHGRNESIWHCTGQVFDIDIRNLPVGEREALDFVLDDIGNMGHLGFIEESRGGGVLHIGCSPSSRDFFNEVFEEAQRAVSKAVTAGVSLP